MGAAYFYHLTETPLERTLPMLLGKCRDAGWRVATVWECALKGRLRLPEGVVPDRLGQWLRSDASILEIRGGS